MIKVACNGGTDVGKVRPTNQDSFHVDPKSSLFIVADGMGGHAGGEIASQLCIETIAAFLAENAPKQKPTTHPFTQISFNLMRAVNFASGKIYERALEEPRFKGMGTTATVVKVVDDYAYFAHVGDSRLYLLRSGFLYQLTFDHSLVNEQLRAGILSEEEAHSHHLKNVITRSVGYQEEEDVDTNVLKLATEDILVLCSDGLHGKVTDQEIAKICGFSKENAVKELINLANKRGGDDNITVIILRIQG
ncbi:MAG: Stp1/IreP family PP2C-type Ser/Thr phosphatase [Oligoflexales bacterium]